MIRPVYFNTDTYFCQKKLSQIIDTSMADITPGLSSHGPDQCILQNTCSQIQYYGTPWDITTIPHITIEDAVNGNYDTDIYLEITSAMWFFLADRSWVKGKKIIVTNYSEAWLRGIPVIIDPYQILDKTVVDDLKIAEEAILVRDNVSTIEGIRCVPYHSFYQESRGCCGNSGKINPSPRWLPWTHHYEQVVYNNINRLGNKDTLFTALLGNGKKHRDDFWKKINESGLVERGFVGGFGYQPIPYDDWQGDFVLRDRYIAKEWMYDAELWVSHETHYSDPFMLPQQANTSITEKIWKPICCGMPYLVNAHPDILKGIEDLGYNTFTSVFGDYIDIDYAVTNDNIIYILENFYSYPIDELRSICTENFERWKEFDAESYNNFFWDKLNIQYE
jgi:hypothetical protein